jgi:hypothetical protein
VTNASGSRSLTATKAADINYNSATSAAFTVTLNKRRHSIVEQSGGHHLRNGVRLQAIERLRAGTWLFTYNPAAGAMLNLGNSQLTVAFTPTDTVN